MKTQITNLINGRKSVIRDLNCKKYLNAKPATSHVGYAGTNRDERAAIAEMVYVENPEQLFLSARGMNFVLPICRSKSGKSWSWNCSISEDEYKALGGWHTDGTLKSYMLCVNDDMTIQILSFTRKSENAQWRLSYLDYVDEAYFTIK